MSEQGKHNRGRKWHALLTDDKLTESERVKVQNWINSTPSALGDLEYYTSSDEFKERAARAKTKAEIFEKKSAKKGTKPKK